MTHKQLPFAEALFQPKVGNSIVELPQYLRGLQVDLSPLGYNLSIHLPSVRADAGWEKEMRDILALPNEDKMSFTGGQATAIIQSLTSSLSAIQGPPGMNYSSPPIMPFAISYYLFFRNREILYWISGRQAPLHSSPWTKWRSYHPGSHGVRSTYPLVTTIITKINYRTQTNHALDETLASYIKSGLKVARFGIARGREGPEPDHVAWQGYKLPQEEGHKVRRRIMEAKRSREDATQELTKLLEETSNGLLSWFRVAPYLKEHFPAFHTAISDTTTDGRSEAGGLYAFWAANKDASEATSLSSVLRDTIPEGFRRCSSSPQEAMPAEPTGSFGGDSGRSVEEMSMVDDPWALDSTERLRLIDSWRQELNKVLLSKVQSAQAALYASKLEFEEASREEVVAKILGFGLFSVPHNHRFKLRTNNILYRRRCDWLHNHASGPRLRTLQKARDRSPHSRRGRRSNRG